MLFTYMSLLMQWKHSDLNFKVTVRERIRYILPMQESIALNNKNDYTKLSLSYES